MRPDVSRLQIVRDQTAIRQSTSAPKNKMRISQDDRAIESKTTGQARIMASPVEANGLSGCSRRGLISGAIAVAGAQHEKTTDFRHIGNGDSRDAGISGGSR